MGKLTRNDALRALAKIAIHAVYYVGSANPDREAEAVQRIEHALDLHLKPERKKSKKLRRSR